MEDSSNLFCLACTENILPTDNHLVTWCGHIWCRWCVNKVFSAACEKEELYPPACCQEIDLSQARRLLRDDVASLYAQKQVEYSSGSRLYCHDVSCQQFLQLNPTGQNKVHCSKCGLQTCSRCRSKAHDGGCPSDPVHESFMEAAKDAGFRQCNNCKRMIEKVSGCNHIICSCRFQFCYKCGLKWKTCHCPQLDHYVQDLDEVLGQAALADELEILRHQYLRRRDEARRLEAEVIRVEIERARTQRQVQRARARVQLDGAYMDGYPHRANAPIPEQLARYIDNTARNINAAAPIPQHLQVYPPPPYWLPHPRVSPRQHPIGQLQRRDAFYIPNDRPPAPIRVAWGMPNDNRPHQQTPVPNQHRRHECPQGSRRVADGDLACHVCGENMIHFIYRCMGCGFQECDRCRGPRPRLQLLADRRTPGTDHERAWSA